MLHNSDSFTDSQNQICNLSLAFHTKIDSAGCARIAAPNAKSGQEPCKIEIFSGTKSLRSAAATEIERADSSSRDQYSVESDSYQEELEDELFAEFKSTSNVKKPIALFSDERLIELSHLEYMEAVVCFDPA